MNELIKIWPDYDNSIAGVPNSIMKKFGITPPGKTLPLLDEWLTGDHKNIIVILLDGMGVNIVKENTSPDGFFRQNLKGEFDSVFPPTTVAATTSIMSGLQPCEHGWLGWDCYYPQVDKNVTVFLNTEQGTDTPAADYNIPWEYTGYESVFDRFGKAGLKAYAVAPFLPPHPDSFEKIADQVKELAGEPGKKYIYAYWREPDGTMHDSGCYSPEAKAVIASLQDQIEALCKELKDSLIIVTADHGHIDTRNVSITDYPRLMECLVRMPSIEPRALNFFVKKEKRMQFEEEFKRQFENQFVLMTKEEVIESQLFGTNAEHECFRDMLGDYLAVGVGDVTIFNTEEEARNFIGVHAGLTKDELKIPLIIYECKQ